MVASGANPSLTAGSEYWLVLSPFDSTTEIGWEGGGSGSTPEATPFSGTNEWVNVGPYTLQFQIDGPTVPEPASWILLGSALAVFSFRNRLQRKTTG